MEYELAITPLRKENEIQPRAAAKSLYIPVVVEGKVKESVAITVAVLVTPTVAISVVCKVDISTTVPTVRTSVCTFVKVSVSVWITTGMPKVQRID